MLKDWRHLACESDPSLWQSLTGTNNDRVLDSRTDESGSDNLIGKEKTDSATGSFSENQEDNEWSGDDEALLELSESTSRGGLVFDTCIQNEYSNNQIISMAPGEGKSPVSLLTDDNNEVLAFPKLFPDGKFGYDTKRTVKLPLTRYFNARILHKDGRFARNTDYIFYAQHVRDLQHINDSITIAMRKARSSNVTASVAKDQTQLTTLIQKDYGYKFLSQIRGSPAYFDKMLLELLALVKQLGPFTWFITLSAADLQWPEVIQIIARQYGQSFSDQDIEDMAWEEKCSWIRRNPVTAARHFDYRLNQFIKHVLLSDNQPIGKISMYMYRIEFQQRGSPHAHMAFWIEGAPHFETSSDKELQNFHDKYVSCSLPSDDEELCSLVKKLQTHVHSLACKKSGKKCRFSFPKPPSDSTMIVRPDNEETAQNNLTKTQVLQILQLVYDKLDELEDDVTIEQLLEQIGISPQLYYSALSKSKKIRWNHHEEKIIRKMC